MKTRYLIPLVLLLLASVACKKEPKVATDKEQTYVREEIKKEDKKVLSNDGYVIGDIATDFSLMNIDDKKVSLADFADAKGFIIIFTCNHCPFAKAYEDRIIALDKKYKTLGYPVIAINPNNPESYPSDSFNNMKIRAEEKGFTFPYLLDDGQHIYPQYGAKKTPHVFILEKAEAGNRVQYIGAIDDNYQDSTKVEQRFVANAVDALLAGKEIQIKETKAIGCSIKG